MLHCSISISPPAKAAYSTGGGVLGKQKRDEEILKLVDFTAKDEKEQKAAIASLKKIVASMPKESKAKVPLISMLSDAEKNPIEGSLGQGGDDIADAIGGDFL